MADFDHDELPPFDGRIQNVAPPIQPETETSEELALMTLLQEIGGSDSDAKVSVYRVQPGTRKTVYVLSYLPEEFSLDRLQADLGAGDYRVQVRTGHILRANKFISVENAPGKSAESAPQTAAPSPVNNDISELGKMMMAGFQQIAQMVAQTAQRPQVDPEQMRRGMMQDMLMMKQLFDRPQENGADKAIEMMMKGFEIAKEITPSDKESGPMDLVIEALKTFGAPIAAAAANHQTPVGPIVAGPYNPVPESQPAMPMESQDMNVREMATRQMLKGHVDFLIEQAAANKDAALYADLIIDQAPDEVLKVFMGQNDEQVMQYLASVNPQVQAYAAWFGSLMKEMRLGLTGPGIPASVEGLAQPRFIDPNATETPLPDAEN